MTWTLGDEGLDPYSELVTVDDIPDWITKLKDELMAKEEIPVCPGCDKVMVTDEIKNRELIHHRWYRCPDCAVAIGLSHKEPTP